MFIFDDIGRKLTQTGHTALQKTKELADVTRLNGLIADEEKRINNSYYQIGKLYFSLYANNCEPDFSALVAIIKKAEADIEDYKQQVQTIRGVKRCDNCGAEIAAEAAFCNACGTKVADAPIIETAGLVKCVNCNKMVKSGMKFCTFCGKAMQEVTQTPGVPLFDSLQTPALKEELKITINSCSSCGNIVDADSDFCTECGFKLK